MTFFILIYSKKRIRYNQVRDNIHLDIKMKEGAVMTTNSEKVPNELLTEKSPYLLQHAYNPVNWYPWGSEAFEKAKAEDKPIFLSIGHSICH